MLIPDDVTVVALGRQALGLAARQARQEGRRTVIAPEFSCQTMVAPWQLEGMSVRLVPVGPDLLMGADGLTAELRRCQGLGERPVVLHCQTFGLRAGDRLRAVLEDALGGGVAVVVDRTHSFLRDQLIGRPGPADGVTEIVSTRKLLPVPEIAWISGADRPMGARGPVDDRLTRARQDYLTNPSVDAFEAAEDLADEAWVPVGPHADALRAIAGFDAERLAGMVLATRRRIALAVPGLDVVNPGAICPLVVRTPDAGDLADRLYARGLVGPLHWDRPENLPSHIEWPADLLCLPSVLDDDGLDVVAQTLSGAI